MDTFRIPTKGGTVRRLVREAVLPAAILATGAACGLLTEPDPFALPFDFTVSGETHMPDAPPEYQAAGLEGEVQLAGEVASSRCYKKQEKSARLRDGVITFAIRFEGTKSGDCPTAVDVTPYVVLIKDVPEGSYTVRIEHHGAIDSYFDEALGLWVDLEDGVRLEADIVVE